MRWMPGFLKRLSGSARLPAEEAVARQEAELKAVRVLGAKRLADARRRAESLLKGAVRCACCKSLLEHLFDRVGSTLFLDDDPERLALAFNDTERDLFSARVLAACIVLSGRERVAPAF